MLLCISRISLREGTPSNGTTPVCSKRGMGYEGVDCTGIHGNLVLMILGPDSSEGIGGRERVGESSKNCQNVGRSHSATTFGGTSGKRHVPF